MVVCLAVGGIAGCNTPGSTVSPVAGGSSVSSPETPPGPGAWPVSAPPAHVRDEGGPSVRSEAQFIELGTGEFVKPADREKEPSAAEGTVTLNFENTALAEVVKVVLGDLLGRNYVVDPEVRGRVTLQTSHPIARQNLLPTLEMLLRMNGAAVVLQGDLYHVVPREQLTQGMLTPQLGDSHAPLPQGYTVRVVPIRHVSASEMAQILKPFAPAGSLVRTDTARNLLLLAGSAVELAGLVETVRVFDVDWLQGMSFGLFTPDFVHAGTLAGELANIFGKGGRGPLAGLVKIVPIERLDALLVVSPRPEYLNRVADWIGRLDRSSGAVGQRLFVYHVRNGRAKDLADVLNQVFGVQEAEEIAPAPPAQLAPGLEPVELRSASPDGGEESESLAAPGSGDGESSGAANGRLSGSGGAPIRIIADEVNNALLIRAGAQQYRQVLDALKEIDITPLQVLIEATIAEVSLTGDLSLGLEWFFKNQAGSRTGELQLDLGAAGIAPTGGFSYVIRKAGEMNVVLNALASASRLNIVSSPSLMVLNHQEASIQVGDQVPVTIQQQQATATDANIINNIEFRDTGVLLTVKPRVSAGGLVVMEIKQEVSDVAPGSAGSLTPTIQQRKINSSVAVQSGETIVLGGLIRENQNQTQSGVPGLAEIPLLGPLFGTTVDSTRRTELVVLITPRAVQDPAVARSITEEFRRKLGILKSFHASSGTEEPQAAKPSQSSPEAAPPDAH